jgi:CRISPR/Cas system-associated exonuclease Cas4 (RecB family)
MTLTLTRPAVQSASPSTRPPNRLAEQITGRTYLSHSQLSLMRSCPRKFAFQYVEKVRPDHVAATLLFGGSIHAALELYYRCQLEGLGVTKEALLSAYHDAWHRERRDASDAVPIRYNKGDDDDKLHALAARMLTAFLKSPLASPKGTILGIEEEMRVVLDPALPDVLAKVDLVTQTDDGLHVIDFKTSKARWNEQKALESGDQLLLYGVTVARMSRNLGVPVRLHFAILTKHKTPLVQLMLVPTDTSRVAAMKDGVAQVWEAIQTGNFYPSPSPMNCTACQFRSK